MDKVKCIFAIVLAVILSLTSAYALDLEPSGKTKTLVAYFSATGNTRAVANRIAEITGADIYEIEPSRPYASNPYDDSQLIQNEAYNDLRPSVANLPSADIIAKYDTIYVGSPLWWHQPAMVVCTFLDAYDLSGKVVIPFITYAATTYLNEGMQKLFKCTPNSIHVPEALPEDIDPDNIREPQNDDAGIDVPNSASAVEGWLNRMGLGPNEDSAGIFDIKTEDFAFSVTDTTDGVSLTMDGSGDVAIHNMNGSVATYTKMDRSLRIPLDKGFYIVNVRTQNATTSKKVIIK